MNKTRFNFAVAQENPPVSVLHFSGTSDGIAIAVASSNNMVYKYTRDSTGERITLVLSLNPVKPGELLWIDSRFIGVRGGPFPAAGSTLVWEFV